MTAQSAALLDSNGEPLEYGENPEYYDAVSICAHSIVKATEAEGDAEKAPPAGICVAFAGAMPDESGRTAAINVALTLAAQERRVAYVETDGFPPEGLLKRYPEKMPAERPELRIPEGWKLFADESSPLIVCRHSAEPVLTNIRMLLESLRAQYEIVIVNLPSLLLSPASAMVADLCGASVLTVRQGVSDRNSIRRAADQLTGLRARFLGCLMTDYDYRRTNRYDEYYHYRRRISGKMKK